jgi:hypothetical protein
MELLSMSKNASVGLREQARNWTCQNLSITEHSGDAAALLRKVADAVEQLGDIEILDITYRRPADPPALELTVTVYFYLRSESRESTAGRSPKGKSKPKRRTRSIR